MKQKPVSKSFSEADDEWIVTVTGINSNYQEWMEKSDGFPNGYVLDDTVFPRDGFQSAFEEISKVFHMANEAGRRIFLNLFLSEVVIKFQGVLRIFPELELSVENAAKKRKLGGKIDYTVGFGKDKDIFVKAPPRELHLVAFEAKTSISESDFWQCVAETAALYKSRVDAQKTTKSVWGILSNATDWEFIHIDESGMLWRSMKFVINLKRYDQSQVLPVYRFIYFVVNR